MLKLKKLQVLGFKSFCDRTELKFHGEGIAAIVGPNGCGKSNISDAISWVLGEQSAKSLRGVQMQDVIFAGTRDRKPTGMAEVSLTLIDPTLCEGEAAGSPEIDIQDSFPADHADDWDEAAVRTRAAEETETVTKESQPGHVIGEDGQPIVMDSDARLEHEAKVEAEAASDTTPSKNDVVLKIRRRKFTNQQLKAGEIVVTRRLFRSGDSEYLLNGKLCRLRDIQDLFMGTGLGPESYAIIEQGRIGQILSSKPHDRRAIIEEAAGITKYKTRKRLAELRLESAKLNLSRINDIFEEVTRQMNSLKRQAAKAERFSKLRDEMREKLRIVLASRFKQLDAESERVHAEIEQLTAELTQRSESVAALENEHHERQHQGYALAADINATRGRLNAMVMETDRTLARRTHNEERCAELVSRVAGLEGELLRSQEQMQSLSAENAANRLVLETAAAEEAAGQAEAQNAQLRSQDAAIAVADAERRQEGRRTQVLDVMHESNRVRTHITQSEERIAALDREAARLEREIAAAFADVEAMGGKRGQLGIEFETQSQHVQSLSTRISSVRSELSEKRHHEIDGKTRLDGMRAEYATALGKRNSLDAVINEHGYSTESVKRLFQSGALAEGRAPVGVLADFLAVDEKHEGVIEDFLRDELNYIVVKSWDAVDEGLNLLKTGVDGRATFLVHPSDAQARFSFAIDETRRPASPPRDSVVPLTRCIQVLDGFGKSLEVILPKLRDGYIAADAKLARELALENPDAFYLAPSGETFHNVTVTGGKQRSEGPLSLKRELRDVTRLMGELEADMRSQEARLLVVHREIEELTSLLERLEGELREAEKQALTHGHALQQMESEIARTEQRVNAYRVEADRVRGERDRRQTEVSQQREELSALEQKRIAIEMEIAAAQAESEQRKQERDAAAVAAMEAASKLATLEERRRGAAASLTRIESLLTEVTARVEGAQSQISAARAEREQREQENATIGERLIVLGQEREAAEQQTQTLQQASEELRARLTEIDSQLKQARHELDAVRERKGELSAKAAKLESDTAHMAETCLNELNIPADELRADTAIALVEGEALTAEDALYREMRQRLEAMGPVNMMALEEYKESAERHGFLETQRKDLLDSIENTQNTIKEIDEVSRQKFEEAFHIINENFQRTFTKLFGGGQGFMRLTDVENSAESGIDIVASPPGKKLQNVLLLSGGEKALTALSLLVGIFQYQPSPFCILDEVDAPLDESNVGRFADMVKEMSSTTQFILITHSKRTMQAAPVMYGVTMQEPGVSKVVSVKFGDSTMKQAASA